MLEFSKPEALGGRSVVFLPVEAGLARRERHLGDPMLHHIFAGIDAYPTSGSVEIFDLYRLVQ